MYNADFYPLSLDEIDEPLIDIGVREELLNAFVQDYLKANPQADYTQVLHVLVKEVRRQIRLFSSWRNLPEMVSEGFDHSLLKKDKAA